MPSATSQPDSSYFWDKLHSLSGIIPIGAFLAEHFWSNSYALVGPASYNATASGLEQIPWRVPVEFLFIWLPIAFHGCYGLYIWWRGKTNVWAHPWMANWLYTLQRWTGIIAFAYIIWHVWLERFVAHGRSTYVGVARDFSHPGYAAFYVIGVLAASFHFGNGIWNFCCKWGIAVTPRAQRAAGWFGALVGVTFAAVGLLIVASFVYNWHPFNGYL
ncbi:MAG: succinate dehydrogenase/fumarate reductase transmembrane subunit [Candidatus Acidiferrales bacterium]